MINRFAKCSSTSESYQVLNEQVSGLLISIKLIDLVKYINDYIVINGGEFVESCLKNLIFVSATMRDQKVVKNMIPRIDLFDLMVISDLKYGTSIINNVRVLLGFSEVDLASMIGDAYVGIKVDLGNIHCYDGTSISVSIENDMLIDAETPVLTLCTLDEISGPDLILTYQKTVENIVDVPNILEAFAGIDVATHIDEENDKIISIEKEGIIKSASFSDYMSYGSVTDEVESLASPLLCRIYEDKDGIPENIIIRSQLNSAYSYIITVSQEMDSERVSRNNIRGTEIIARKVANLERKNPSFAKAMRRAELITDSSVYEKMVSAGKKIEKLENKN